MTLVHLCSTMPMMRIAYLSRISICFLLLLAAAALAYRLDIAMHANRQRRIDLAEIRDVRYDLLNATVWAERIAPIFAKKIDAFDLTSNKEALRPSIEKMVERMIAQSGGIIQSQLANNKSLGIFGAQIGQLLAPMLNVNSLRAHVPALTNTILAELGKPEAKKAIQQSLRDTLFASSSTTFAAVDMTEYKAILAKYGCADAKACQGMLDATIAGEESRIRRNAVLVIALAAGAFAVVMLRRSPVRKSEAMLLAVFCGVLLWSGLRNPMIDIDARISRLRFQLSGEPVEFNDQVLFFQSKSILDVVRLLLETREFGMVTVGLMVLAFSVVFPIAKLIASGIYAYRVGGLENNRVVQFFALKSGKWSMADVLVVAMFMAYIGFDGVISSQLKDLRSATGGLDVFTTNGTTLQAGFFLFLGFCVAGMVLGTVLSKVTRSGISPRAETRDEMPA